MGNVLEAVNEQLNGYSFWLEVQEKHPDALKIKVSDEWKDWISDQPKAMKALAGSQEVEDTIKILDYYKEDIAKAKVASKDDKDRGKKKKKDDLHKHSARTKTEVAGRDKKDTGDSDDEEAGWELGGKE